MLNCTDLACVLHHHHFYAHLHHLKHHLQDDNDNSAIGDGSDVNNDDNTQNLLNDTDSELSSLSHVDAPSDVIYMACGVVIAMILVGLIIVLVAVTINKLRKREETSVSPVNVEAQTTGHHNYYHHNHHHHHHQPSQVLSVTTATTTTTAVNSTTTSTTEQQQQQINNGCSLDQQQQQPIAYRQNPSSVWVFPPLPPQPNIYHCANHHDALAHLNDKAGFKGFRKQFSGRFKRLVAKKSHEPAPAIPPELKPQLKTIYVY